MTAWHAWVAGWIATIAGLVGGGGVWALAYALAADRVADVGQGVFLVFAFATLLMLAWTSEARPEHLTRADQEELRAARAEVRLRAAIERAEREAGLRDEGA